MAALTEDGNLDFHALGRPQAYKMAAGVTLFRHVLVCLDSAGFAVPAADTAALSKAIGITDRFAANPGAAGDEEVIVRRGELAWIPTSGSDALTQTDVGRKAFVLDDNTAVKQAGTTNGIEAGEVIAVRADAALLKIGVE